MDEAVITFVGSERNSDHDYDEAVPEFYPVTKVYRVKFEDAVDFFNMMELLTNGGSAINVTSVEKLH